MSAKCPRTPGYAAITGLATIARNEVDRGLFSGAHKTGFSACAERDLQWFVTAVRKTNAIPATGTALAVLWQ